MISKLGISVYQSSGFEKNRTIIDTAVKRGIDLIFTSFHIPEEKDEIDHHQIELMINYCKTLGVRLCADVSIQTLKILNLSHIYQLYEMGIYCLRFDYGIDLETICKCSRTNMVMINASNLNEETILAYQKEKMDFNNVIAAHNFYPKPHTGLSLPFVKAKNKLCHRYGIETLAFLPGHKESRGPLFNYLPTIEHHRYLSPLVGAMELVFEAETDYLLIGDIDYNMAYDSGLKQILEQKVVLETELNDFRFKSILLNKTLSNRSDLSEYTVRIVESRKPDLINFTVDPDNEHCSIEIGDIVFSNLLYGRYVNEIEIARLPYAKSEKENIIGTVAEPYRCCLPYIDEKRRFILIEHI